MNDYFLNQLYNIEFSPADFANVGLNSSNTTIKDRNAYKDLDVVKENPLLQTDGTFDEDKFNNLYNLALQGFRQMTLTGSNEKLTSSYSAFRDDIFADSGTKNLGAETIITKIANPNKQLIGFVSSNIREAPTMSVRELAQANSTWNGEKWVDSPNESLWDNFINPKVLAQWDFDADALGNPTNDKDKIVYHKGEKKIDPISGTYYYETLNGRNIYGRDVLSVWDTFTVDGSPLNKYDFFDSDDIEKSGTGSLVKAVVKVAPALIPTTAPWYIAARVLLNTADLAGKVMKMTTGSNNETASWLEAINATWTQSSSDHSTGSSELGIDSHPWSLENILNLSADVFTQIGEQRWMFTHLPSLLSGNKLGFSENARKAFINSKTRKLLELFKNGKVAEGENVLDMYMAATSEAQTMLQNKMKGAEKFGEYLSKLYMTGITVADSYGEAKEAGLSDTEASLFTLAYALGEYGILNTNLGEHVLPELRAERRRMESALTKLAHATPAEKQDTRAWYKKILSGAKDAIVGDFNDASVRKSIQAGSNVEAFLKIMGSNALGEGVEEVSEELWFDIAKSLQNAAVDLKLTQTDNKLEAFDNGNLELAFNRYALNFVGGVIGGGIAVMLPGFLQGIKNMLGSNMSLEQAYLEIVALVRNGKKKELFKVIDKLEIGNSNLNTAEDGPGTEKDNLNLANRLLLKGTINMIESLLNTNGVSIDDESILKNISLDARNLIKFLTLLGGSERVGSTILMSYVLNFNTLATEIADVSSKIQALEKKDGDKSSSLTSEDLAQLATLKLRLLKLTLQKDMYLNGQMSKLVMPKVLFELSPIISHAYISTNFKDYVEKVEKRVLSEIPADRLEQLKEEWELYKAGSYVDDLQQAYAFFNLINKNFSERLAAFDLEYFRNPLDVLLDIGNMFRLRESELLNTDMHPEDVLSGATNYSQSRGIAENPKVQRLMLGLIALAHEIDPNLENDVGNIMLLPDTIEELKELVGEEEYNNTFLPFLLQASHYLGKVFDEETVNLKELRESELNRIAEDILVNYSSEVKEVLKNIKYLNKDIRDFLNRDLFILTLNKDGVLLDDEYDEYEERSNLLREYREIINEKPNSPIEELADLFLLSIGDESFKISELVGFLEGLISTAANENQINKFNYSSNIQEQIDHALKVIELLSSHIIAARTDAGKLGNMFGFNSMLNKLSPDYKLTEIDKGNADSMMMDLAKLKSRLEYFQNIFKTSSGQKLAELKKIKSRVDFNFINRLKYIISILPDNEELNSILSSLETFEELSKKEETERYKLDDTKKKTLSLESIKLLDALYDYFQNHENLFDIIEKLTLLPSSTEVSKSYNGTIVNSHLNDFDDRTFIGMLAASAAVRASDFYGVFKNSLNPKFAPIPGQELATRMAFSFLMNLPLFERVGKLYNEKLLKELKDVSGEFFWDNYGKVISEDSKLDNSYALLFLHTFLVEGGPGTGKSSGFYSTLINMLKATYPNLLKKVWVIHTNADKATKLGKDIGLEESQIVGMDKDAYLKRIYPEYIPATYKDGVIQESLDNLELDPETGIYHRKGVNLATGIELPTLIIFDESTRFSLLDMLISEKFQTENGIHGIATGDYNQIGAVGLILTDDNNFIYFGTDAGNFFHSPILGTSMRPDNNLKDINVENFREEKLRLLRELKAGTVSTRLALQYFETDTDIYGDKIMDATDPTVQLNILKMLDSLKDGEKLNFITDNKDSDIYKYLQELNTTHEKYKGKINIVDSNASQGEEAQYYIIDLKSIDISSEKNSNRGNHQHFLNTFYTAISRAKLATLILKNSNISAVAYSEPAKEVIKTNLALKAIEEYSNDLINTLETIIGNKIPFVNISKKGTIIPPTPPTPPIPDGDTSDEDTSKLNKRKVIIDNSKDREYNMLLHTMPVNETGFEEDEDGNLVVSNDEAYEKRIDSLNGLTKLGEISNSDTFAFGLDEKGKLLNLEKALQILTNLRLAGILYDNKEELLTYIVDLLGLTVPKSELGLDYLFIIPSNIEDPSKKIGNFKRLWFSAKEKLLGIFLSKHSPEKLAQINENNKKFALNLYRVVDGKHVNLVTIPLAIFTSPLTMMETKGFESLKALFVTLAGRNQDKMINLLQDADVINSLPSEGQINASKLLKHFLIYNYKSKDGDAVVYLPDDFTLAGSAKSLTGPQITVTDRGTDYFYTEDYTYNNGEYIPLSKLAELHHLSKDVYFALEDVIDAAGNVVIEKGHRFVLVSDFTDFSSDKDMFVEFVNSELGPKPKGRVSPIYVSSPKIGITDYIINFALLYKSRAQREEDLTEIDTSLGIHTTDFRLAEFITKEGSPFDVYIKSLNSGDTSFQLKWQIFKNVVAEISKSSDIMETLSLKMADSPYIELIKADDSASTEIKRVINAFKLQYVHSDMTVKKFIANQIKNFILKNREGVFDSIPWKDGNLDISAISTNIEKLTESLPDSWKEGIYIKLEPKSEENDLIIGSYTFIPIKSENYESLTENFNVGDRSIRTNGKIDTTALVMDVSNIMDLILNTINDPVEKLNLVLKYINDSKEHIEPAPPTARIDIPEHTLSAFGDKLESIIINNPDAFKDVDLSNSSEVLSALNSIGYGVLDLDIVKVPNNITQDHFLCPIVKFSTGEFGIIVGDNDIRNLTYDGLQAFKEEAEYRYLFNEDGTVANPIIHPILAEAIESLKPPPTGKTIQGLKNILDKIKEDLAPIMANNPTLFPSYINNIEDLMFNIKDFIINKLSNFAEYFELSEGYENIDILSWTVEQIDQMAANYTSDENCIYKIR